MPPVRLRALVKPRACSISTARRAAAAALAVDDDLLVRIELAELLRRTAPSGISSAPGMLQIAASCGSRTSMSRRRVAAVHALLQFLDGDVHASAPGGATSQYPAYAFSSLIVGCSPQTGQSGSFGSFSSRNRIRSAS